METRAIKIYNTPPFTVRVTKREKDYTRPLMKARPFSFNSFS
jgi:hypothetical protein